MKDLTGLTDEQWNKRYPNFPKDEPFLACPCCGLLNIDLNFLDKYQRARTLADIPFIITSGCRCKKHNKSKKVGGKKNSKHLASAKKKCTAIDTSCLSDRKRGIISDALFSVGLVHRGVDEEFIHCDNSKRVAIWLY